jgi:hypothetical protein
MIFTMKHFFGCNHPGRVIFEIKLVTCFFENTFWPSLAAVENG